MSSGPFVDSRYENLAGNVVYPCRLQQETLDLDIGGSTNDAPVAAVTTGVARIKLRKGKREFGPTIRTVTVEMTAAGTGLNAYAEVGDRFILPILSNTFFNGISVGDTGTYLGAACEVKAKFPE
jgi:hypothetical protein